MDGLNGRLKWHRAALLMNNLCNSDMLLWGGGPWGGLTWEFLVLRRGEVR